MSPLFDYLKKKNSSLPWDSAFNGSATIDDIDPEKVEKFITLARNKRKSNLTYNPGNLLGTLCKINLASKDGRLTNPALLLFAREPQLFFRVSEVKCMVFLSPVKGKPILTSQVFEGSLFEMVDSTVAFVMQHIEAYAGTQSSKDVVYEIPYYAVFEVIVNACTHRSYESNGSIQVEIYPDRIEVWNPGALPYGITLEQLSSKHVSLPPNPNLAYSVFLSGYIERIGTGTTDLIDYCLKAGLRAPEFNQDEIGITVTIWRKEYKNNVTSNVAPGVSSNKQAIRAKNILTEIMINRHTTIVELASKYGVTSRTIHRDFSLLRKTYSITWIPTGQYTGYWEIGKLE